MWKSHFNDELLMLLGPIISRLFTCSNAEKNRIKKTKGAYSSPISVIGSSNISNVKGKGRERERMNKKIAFCPKMFPHSTGQDLFEEMELDGRFKILSFLLYILWFYGKCPIL